MDSDTRSASLRLRIGDEPEADSLQALRISLKVGHAPAAEQSNYLQSLGLQESDVENKPIIIVDCDDQAAAEGVVELLKGLPEKIPIPNMAEMVDKVKPDFRVQGNQVIIAVSEAPVPSEFIESLTEEIPEQALNANNLLEVSVRTGTGGAVGEIIQNTLHNGGQIGFKLQVHKDLPASVIGFISSTLMGSPPPEHQLNILNQAITLFNSVELNLSTKSLNPDIENQLGGANSPVLAMIGQANNLQQFVPPQVGEFAQLKGVKGPLEIYFTSSGVVAVNIHAHLPGLGNVLFN